MERTTQPLRGTPIGLLFFALFNSILGLSILFPILAPLGRELGLSELQVGSLSSAYAVMQLIASPFWGRRSERVGRKPVLLTGIVGFSLSFGAFGVVALLGMRHQLSAGPLYALLLAARLVGGAISSATMPTAQAYVADVTTREERTRGMAVIGAAFGLGIIFGPGIGAALSTFGLLVPVFVSAGLAVINGLFVWWRLPEPERLARTEQRSMRATARTLWPLLAVALAVSVAAVSMEQTIAFLFQDRLALSAKDTARYVGTALVVYGLVAVAMQGFVVRKFRIEPRALVMYGIPLACLGLLSLTIARQFAALTAALALQGLGQGLTLPGLTSAISLAVPDEDQGVAAGLNSSTQALGRFVGPLCGTALYELREPLPYAFGASLLAIAFIVVALTRVGRDTAPAAPPS